MTADELLSRWDRQQEAYIADREGRFDAIMDVLEFDSGVSDGGPSFTVVDLACGPGALATRILDRFEHAHVIGIDYDPTLLRLAESQAGHYGGRLQLHDLDLADPSWPQQLDDNVEQPPRAFVSTTALHWLTPTQLLEVYTQACRMLESGGVLLNGDHLRFDQRSPRAEQWALAHDARTQHQEFERGAPQWQQWWDQLHESPGMGDLIPVRRSRFDGRDGMPPTAVDFHLAALRQAGFTEVGTIWQLFDDYVVYGTV